MCGICGVFQSGNESCISAPVLEAMCDSLQHRGPDSGGVWIDEAAGVALGHRRLAIIDLSPTGSQPMHSADNRWVIVYNGEIYNYQDLRTELAGLGHSFRGTSDTEVILAGFSQWGVECTLKKLVGMFAIALWDRQERVLYLARDRMGEKPLYYGWMGRVLLFGSELKALRAHPAWQAEIDRNALALYFRFSHIPAPYSIYQGIFKLPPGTFLTLSMAGSVPEYLPAPAPFWSLRDVTESATSDPYRGSDQEAVAELDSLLRVAVAGQMISDVPLGAFLSGGIDSSTVVALMQAQSSRPVRTFSIGFDDVAYNEAAYAKAVARHLGTDHTELYVAAPDALAVIPRLPQLYDEPFADSSQIPTFLVAQMARQHVTVSLSGDGGDEVFCGYNRHVQLARLWNRIRLVPLPLRKGIASMIRSVPSAWSEPILRRRKSGVLADQVQKAAAILGLSDLESMYLRLTYVWERPTDLVLNSVEPRTLLSERAGWPQLPTDLERLLYLEAATSLPDDMLVKVDRAAMGVSLETRVPLLDQRVVEFAWRLPLAMKLRAGVGKWILRQVLHKYVPQSLTEHPKSGFSAPIDMWLRGPMRDWAEDLLSESRLRQQGIIEPQLVQQKWREHLGGHRKWQHHLWGVLMFEAWLDSAKIRIA